MSLVVTTIGARVHAPAEAPDAVRHRRDPNVSERDVQV